MRALLHAAALLLCAELLCAGVLLVASGKGFVYAPELGGARAASGLLAWCIDAAGAGVVLAAGLHGGSYLFVRRYFQLQWWRDVALTAGLAAALVVGGLYIGRELTNGAL